MEHISFGSVESLHNKVKQANKKYIGPMEYSIKPKLHGTNASIVFDGKSKKNYAQSRKNVINSDKDNAGFATWVESLNLKIPNRLDGMVPNGGEDKWILYGEWAGPGVQKNDAVCQIPQKTFFVFALRSIYGSSELVTTDPNHLQNVILPVVGLSGRKDVRVIPVIGKVQIDMNGDKHHLELVENTINSFVDQFEEYDPYINAEYGIKDKGEGVVVYPETIEWDLYKSWMFKAKTENHRVNKSKKAANAKVEVSPDVIDFADRFATIPRFEQGISDLGIDIEMSNMGKFLKWVNEDVIKESSDELEASELNWKQCSKHITQKAREWFMREAKRIV